MGVIRSQTGCSNSTEKGMSPEPQNHIGKTSERLGVSLTIGGDLAVARIGFGAMRLGGPGIWGGPRDPDSARMVLRRAIELSSFWCNGRVREELAAGMRNEPRRR